MYKIILRYFWIHKSERKQTTWKETYTDWKNTDLLSLIINWNLHTKLRKSGHKIPPKASHHICIAAGSWEHNPQWGAFAINWWRLESWGETSGGCNVHFITLSPSWILHAVLYIDSVHFYPIDIGSCTKWLSLFCFSHPPRYFSLGVKV